VPWTIKTVNSAWARGSGFTHRTIDWMRIRGVSTARPPSSPPRCLFQQALVRLGLHVLVEGGPLIGMVETWRAAGSPRSDALSRFNKKGWGTIVGGILTANGLPDFLAIEIDEHSTAPRTIVVRRKKVSGLVIEKMPLPRRARCSRRRGHGPVGVVESVFLFSRVCVMRANRAPVWGPAGQITRLFRCGVLPMSARHFR
jgi:hypothetical protein